MTLDTAKYLRDILKKLGAEVVLTREKDTDFLEEGDRIDDKICLRNRARRIRKLFSEAYGDHKEKGKSYKYIFISIHFNSFNGKASGAEVYCHTSNEQGDRELARRILDEIVKLGFKDRGVKTKDWCVLNEGAENVEDVEVDSVLVEPCFIDNPEDWVSAKSKTSCKINSLKKNFSFDFGIKIN